MKQCSKCRVAQPLGDFSPNNKTSDGRASVCKVCAREYARAHNQKPQVKERRRIYSSRAEVRERECLARKNDAFRAKSAAQQRRYLADGRLKVLSLLGGSCKCCGESFLPFLEIHHIEGDGQKHRAIGGTLGAIRSIISGKYPSEKLTILCANCHTAITRYGSCQRHCS